MAKPRMLKMAPMMAPMKMAPMKRVGDELTPQQKAGVKRYHKEKKDLKQRNVGYKPGAFYDKKGKNPDTGAERSIGGQGGFKSRRSSGPSKDFRDDIGEGRRPPMTPARRAAIKQRNAERTPEQQASDKKHADDFYNSFMKKEHYSWRDSFELTENQANRMKMQQQRQKQNQGRAAQQFSVLKPKPIQGRVSHSSQNINGNFPNKR